MKKPNLAPQGLFNPLDEDFKVEWLDQENKTYTLTIPAHDVGYFKKDKYQFMKKHLSDAVYNSKTLQKTSNSEEEYERIYKEIEVEI